MAAGRERVGRWLLYGLIGAELALLLLTHLGLVVASGSFGSLLLFFPMNALTCGFLFLLAHTGQAGLKWFIIFVQFVRGGFQVLFFLDLARLSSSEGAFVSVRAASILGPVGVCYWATAIACAWR
jgi:hypothetical protein